MYTPKTNNAKNAERYADQFTVRLAMPCESTSPSLDLHEGHWVTRNAT
ncbi:MAG: hypothetical protein U5R30_05035 [Deltaproteobacteria bacterium]|nr:hypothetical protein [Deltaproteobacteria bacterium]